MTRYLLDTNIVSADLVRHPQCRVVEQIRKIGEARICTSIIVAAELRYGAAKKGSERLTAQLETVLAALTRFVTDGRLEADNNIAANPINRIDELMPWQTPSG